MKSKKPKPYKVVIELSLSPLHVWPDKIDPPPPDPTPEDVVKVITSSTEDLNEWFYNWNLGYGATVRIVDDQNREAVFSAENWSEEDSESD